MLKFVNGERDLRGKRIDPIKNSKEEIIVVANVDSSATDDGGSVDAINDENVTTAILATNPTGNDVDATIVHGYAIILSSSIDDLNANEPWIRYATTIPSNEPHVLRLSIYSTIRHVPSSSC